MKVLIADDSKAIRLLLKGLLRQCAVEDVLEATDGPEALAVLERTSIDLVLLDMQMPSMDGLECLAVLRERLGDRPIPPVVMISAEEDPTIMDRARSLGARAFLNKPCTTADLRAVLANLS
jgi:two-component system chemotaxis response regulator CheY